MDCLGFFRKEGLERCVEAVDYDNGWRLARRIYMKAVRNSNLHTCPSARAALTRRSDCQVAQAATPGHYSARL